MALRAILPLLALLLGALQASLALRHSGLFSKRGMASSSGMMKGRFFDRIIVVPLENAFVADVLANQDILKLSQHRCSRLYGSFMGATHPSEPNYLAMVSGDYFGIGDDSNHVVSSGDGTPEGDIKNAITVIDRLEDKGISWKVYAENYPGSISASAAASKFVDPQGCGSRTDTNKTTMQCYSSGGCFFGAFLDVDSVSFDNRLYARKHVPFLQFQNFVTNETRCSKVVESSQFWSDLSAGTLPQYIMYVPNQCNDGHGTNKNCQYNYYNGDATAAVASFMKGFLNNLTSIVDKYLGRTVVVFVYDENDYASARNQVFTMAYGCGVVSPGPLFSCKMYPQLCHATPSQISNLVPVCYSDKGVYGQGGNILCGPNAGQHPIEKLAAPFSFFDGLKIDSMTYTHSSIVTLILQNWGLGLLWLTGDGAQPMRLSGNEPTFWMYM